MDHKTDRRVIRSKRAIENAFLSLIEEKGFDTLSVKEITTRANVGRKTFYLHFKDIYDLLDQILDKEISRLAHACEKEEAQDYEEGAASWFLFAASRAKLYAPLLTSRKTDAFRRRLLLMIMDTFRQKSAALGGTMDETDIHFFSTAVVGTLEAMLLGELPTSPASTGRYVGRLLKQNLEKRNPAESIH